MKKLQMKKLSVIALFALSFTQVCNAELVLVVNGKNCQNKSIDVEFRKKDSKGKYGKIHKISAQPGTRIYDINIDEDMEYGVAIAGRRNGKHKHKGNSFIGMNRWVVNDGKNDHDVLWNEDENKKSASVIGAAAVGSAVVAAAVVSSDDSSEKIASLVSSDDSSEKIASLVSSDKMTKTSIDGVAPDA